MTTPKSSSVRAAALAALVLLLVTGCGGHRHVATHADEHGGSGPETADGLNCFVVETYDVGWTGFGHSNYTSGVYCKGERP